MVYLWFVNNMVKKKKNLKNYILVTGGSGFIGSAITRYLVEQKKKLLYLTIIREENYQD